MNVPWKLLILIDVVSLSISAWLIYYATTTPDSDLIYTARRAINVCIVVLMISVGISIYKIYRRTRKK